MSYIIPVVTCDPPADIAHTEYSPSQVEYIWQTEIHYDCDPLYHYIGGVNVTTCNESGIFPPVDFDCSGKLENYITYYEDLLTYIKIHKKNIPRKK